MKNLLFISILSLLPAAAVAAVEAKPAPAANTAAEAAVETAEVAVVPVKPTVNHDTIIKLIEEIKPPRQGVSNQAVASVRSPFIVFVEKKNEKGTKKRYVPRKTSKGGLTLETVINKVVKINGDWYKEGEKIHGYTIAKVSKDQVLLKSGNIEKTLYLHKTDDKIQFKVN